MSLFAGLSRRLRKWRRWWPMLAVLCFTGIVIIYKVGGQMTSLPQVVSLSGMISRRSPRLAHALTPYLEGHNQNDVIDKFLGQLAITSKHEEDKSHLQETSVKQSNHEETRKATQNVMIESNLHEKTKKATQKAAIESDLHEKKKNTPPKELVKSRGEVHIDARTTTKRKDTDWNQHMAGACRKHNITWARDKPSLHQLGNIVVDDKHKVMFCPIPKVSCTTWVRIGLALGGHINMSETFNVRSEVIHASWGKLKYLSQYNETEALDRLQTYFKFIVVRDPYERILSAFRNKFERKDRLTSFHNVFGKAIVRKYRKGVNLRTLTNEEMRRPTFGEFVQYLSDPESNIKMNNHWIQYHRLCEPCFIHYDFVANMENMGVEGNAVLERIGVGDKIKLPSRGAIGYIHKKTSDVMSTYFANVSDSVLDGLYRQYQLDFDIFKLPYTRPGK